MNVADLPARLADKIVVNDITGCWNWIAALSNGGYGVVGNGSSTTSAHRVTYALLVGPIPEDCHHVDHLCWNKRCVNPAHLEPVTASENQTRWRRATGRTAKPKPPPKRTPRQHGEHRMYVAGCRCELCRAANRERTYAVVAAMRERGLAPGDPRHGTAGGYNNWGCRCDLCRKAQSAANRPHQQAYRARQLAKRAAA